MWQAHAIVAGWGHDASDPIVRISAADPHGPVAPEPVRPARQIDRQGEAMQYWTRDGLWITVSATPISQSTCRLTIVLTDVHAHSWKSEREIAMHEADCATIEHTAAHVASLMAELIPRPPIV